MTFSQRRHDDQRLPLSSSLCDPRAVSEDAFADHLRLGSHAAPGRLNPSRSILVIVAAFLIALLGSLPLLSRYHFDEGWYTNAAIEMVRTGDYLTPRYADGSVRFRKPIVTYWVLVASYTTMGIGLVASRLPFLLAGCIVLWVTYRIGRSATGDSHTGVAAAAILASNIEFMESATKSTPDMLQCLFLTLSIWGAVEIIFQQRRESHWYALLYVGAGLAIATKGMLAVMLMLFVWAFARFRPMTDRIEHPASCTRDGSALGLLIPLSWFVGLDAFARKRGDLYDCSKIKSAIAWKALQTFILTNVLLYLLTPFRFFAPWIVLLVIAVLTQRDLLFQYMSGTEAVGLVCSRMVSGQCDPDFSLGNLMRSRYLLPTYPLLAVLLADLLMQMSSQSSRMFHRRNSTVSGPDGDAMRARTRCGSHRLRLDTSMLAGGFSSQPVALALYSTTFHRRLVACSVALSLTIIAAFATFEQFIKPVFITSPAREITRRLLELHPLPSRSPPWMSASP